jgi:hypothetical protein
VFFNDAIEIVTNTKRVDEIAHLPLYAVREKKRGRGDLDSLPLYRLYGTLRNFLGGGMYLRFLLLTIQWLHPRASYFLRVFFARRFHCGHRVETDGQI